MAFIYKITNNINKKVYIGKTSLPSIEERFKSHIQDSKKERNEKRPLYDAFHKYGIENFSIEEIEKVANDEIASKREIYWIDYYRSYIGFDDCNGYNATLGGDSRRYYDYEEIANKYSELKNVNDTAKFFNCDPSVVVNACKENNISILSAVESTKRKTSKKVAMLDKNTLEVVKVYDSITNAFKDLKHKKTGGISNVCNNKTKTYLGYSWKYI